MSYVKYEPYDIFEFFINQYKSMGYVKYEPVEVVNGTHDRLFLSDSDNIISKI